MKHVVATSWCTRCTLKDLQIGEIGVLHEGIGRDQAYADCSVLCISRTGAAGSKAWVLLEDPSWVCWDSEARAEPGVSLGGTTRVSIGDTPCQRLPIGAEVKIRVGQGRE